MVLYSLFISGTPPDSGDSLGEQEERDYLRPEETEAQGAKGKGSFVVSVAAGAPIWVPGFVPPVSAPLPHKHMWGVWEGVGTHAHP